MGRKKKQTMGNLCLKIRMQVKWQQTWFFKLYFFTQGQTHKDTWDAIRDISLCSGFSQYETDLIVALAGIHSLQYILYLNFQSVHKMWHLIKTVFVFITSLSLRTMWQQWASDCTCTHTSSRSQAGGLIIFLVCAALNHTEFYGWIKTTKINS